MPRLSEGIALLNLPVEGDQPGLTLMGVSGRVYADNVACEEALKELGLEFLSNADARKILQRRVESSD